MHGVAVYLAMTRSSLRTGGKNYLNSMQVTSENLYILLSTQLRTKCLRMFSPYLANKLCVIYSGSYINNNFSITRDFKRLYVFHTSNVDIHEHVRPFLYVTFSVAAACLQWSSWHTRRGCQSMVNVFTVPIDTDVNFCTGDSFERYNGGRGIILDVKDLEFVGHVSKADLNDFVCVENRAISARDNVYPDVATQFLGITIDEPKSLIDCLRLCYFMNP